MIEIAPVSNAAQAQGKDGSQAAPRTVACVYSSTAPKPPSALRNTSAQQEKRDVVTHPKRQAGMVGRIETHTRLSSTAGFAQRGAIKHERLFTTDIDCSTRQFAVHRRENVERPITPPAVFPTANPVSAGKKRYDGSGSFSIIPPLFKEYCPARIMPRCVELSTIGSNVMDAKPICWDQRKYQEKLQLDQNETADLPDQAGTTAVNSHLPESSNRGQRVQDRATVERAAQNRAHHFWKLEVTLDLIKRTSLYKIFVRFCDYRTRIQLVVSTADFIVKALENDYSPLQPVPALGHHPLTWMLSIPNINFSCKELSNHYSDTVGSSAGEVESTSGGEAEDVSGIDAQEDVRNELAHYLRTPEDRAIFQLLTAMHNGEGRKSGVAALLDIIMALLHKPSVKPLDMEEFGVTMGAVCTELRREISLMHTIIKRLMARVEKRKNMVTKDWVRTMGTITRPHGELPQLTGYHVPTEFEIGLLLDAQTGALEDPIISFTGVNLKEEDIEMWFRFIKDFHVTGVSVLKVEHVVESVALVMAQVSAPVTLQETAYEIFGYNGAFSKKVQVNEINLHACPAIKSTRLPEDGPRGEQTSIHSGRSVASSPSPIQPVSDLAHSLFALDVLGHDPFHTHHDLDFALEEITRLLRCAFHFCLERRKEDQCYNESTCVGEKEKAEALLAVYASWAQELENLLEYMWTAELRVANVHFIHSLLREHAPQLYNTFREEHRTYLRGRPPAKKLDTFTALVEKYNPLQDRTVNVYIASDVQRRYPKNFLIMSVCHEGFAQLKECENMVFWLMIKLYSSAVKAHKEKQRSTKKITAPHPTILKGPLLINHERIESLTTPGYHLNEKANPLLLPHCSKPIQILLWVEKLVGCPLRVRPTAEMGNLPSSPRPIGEMSPYHSRTTALNAKGPTGGKSEAQYGAVMDSFVVTDYLRQLYQAPETVKQ